MFSHSVLIFSQKVWCSFALFGAYTFNILIVSLLCQFIDRMAALPGIRTSIVALEALVSSLFRTKAMPAELLGRVGSLEFSIDRRRENRESSWDW